MQVTVTGNSDCVTAIRMRAAPLAPVTLSALKQAITTAHSSTAFQALCESMSGPAPMLEGLFGHDISAVHSRPMSVFASKGHDNASSEEVAYFMNHPTTRLSDVAPYFSKITVCSLANASLAQQ